MRRVTTSVIQMHRQSRMTSLRASLRIGSRDVQIVKCGGCPGDEGG